MHFLFQKGNHFEVSLNVVLVFVAGLTISSEEIVEEESSSEESDDDEVDDGEPSHQRGATPPPNDVICKL